MLSSDVRARYDGGIGIFVEVGDGVLVQHIHQQLCHALYQSAFLFLGNTLLGDACNQELALPMISLSFLAPSQGESFPAPIGT
jgi:hypothetical protein